MAVNNIGEDDGPLTSETLERASNAALAEVGAGTVTSAERNGGGVSRYELQLRLDNGDEVDVELNDAFDKVWVGDLDTNSSNSPTDGSPSTAAPSAAPGATGATASQRASAEAAAIAAIGSARVIDFDTDDDWDHVYEVEVTLDGSDRDVELDANFVVVRIDDIDQ